MFKYEMFADDMINSLPNNPLESVKKLIEGYIEYVEHQHFEPLTHFEQCLDGYALISTYNQTYNLDLPLSEINSDDKEQIIKTLNDSIADCIRHLITKVSIKAEALALFLITRQHATLSC